MWLIACGHRGGEPQPPSVGTLPMPAFAVSDQSLALELQAPWSLTATDGSGLVLARVDAKAVVQGPLAFTELHLYFHNPENRVREGQFAITLPPRAAVSRFAMETDGKWLEAEVVEKLRARRAYEDFLHRKQDPALMEKAEGNQFTARVFPIPANGDKHLVLSFSQELPGERYTLPLRGLPAIDRVDVRLATLGADGRKTEQVLAQAHWQPDRDFVSTTPLAADAIASGTAVAAQLAVADPSTARDVPTALTLLVDTSASRTLGFARTVANVDRMIGELRRRHGDGLLLQVAAFDQETQPIFSGPIADWGAAARQALLARGAAGASDLGQAIAWLAQTGAHGRLVIVGDGVVTAGAKPEAVLASIKQLRGVERVDVVLSGGIRDDGFASRLARTSARPGAVLDLDTGVDDAVAALSERMLTDLAVDVRGASWVYPRTIAAARPGTRVMVYAQLKAPQKALDVTIAGAHHAVGVVAGTPALVDRAVAAAEVGELENRLAIASGDTRELRDSIAHKAIAARLISSQTSMLVLETEADYARFGIDRTALSDILEVGPDGLVQRHRPALIAAPRKAPELQKETNAAAKAKKTVTANEPEKRLADPDDDGEGGDADDGKVFEPKPEPKLAPGAPPPPPPPPTARPIVNRPPISPAAQPARARRLDRSRDASEDEGGEEASAEIGSDTGTAREVWPPRDAPAPLTGEMADIARAIAKRDTTAALAKARAWHEREPGNVLAFVALGETLEARQDLAAAARAYGSIIDLFPGRADLRRFAGERLERIGDRSRPLAIDTYERAVADRPDHMTGHRLLAYALLRAGKHADALAAILAGLEQKYPDGRFRGGERLLRDDAGLIGAAYAAAVPGKRTEIAAVLAKHGLAIATAASTRFVLYWETDANDVDFHIQDARGGHAFYSHKQLPSGGELYEDITDGYGPECFAIPGTPKAGPYRLSINYYSQGPMGYGMGVLQIVRHDGKGHLAFEDRPYLIMADHAYVDLGSFR